MLQRGIVAECVFFNKDGREIRDFRKSWRMACKYAGLAEEIEIEKNENGKPIMKIIPLRIPFDFRRTAVRNLVRTGIHERPAMQMTGHKTRSVFERYNVTKGADLKDAANEVKSVLTNPTGINSVMIAPKVSSPTNSDLPLNTSTSMPGRGIEPLRPLRGSGF